jgi:hypothetical protein
MLHNPCKVSFPSRVSGGRLMVSQASSTSLHFTLNVRFFTEAGAYILTLISP